MGGDKLKSNQMKKINSLSAILVVVVIVTLTLLGKGIARYFQFQSESLTIILTTIVGIILIGALLSFQKKVQ